MKTLVEKLRRHWEQWGSPASEDEGVNERVMAFHCKEAADEIERLQQSKSWPSVDDLMRTIYEIDKLAHDAVEEDEDTQAAWETCRRIYEKTLAARILFANHKPEQPHKPSTAPEALCPFCKKVGCPPDCMGHYP